MVVGNPGLVVKGEDSHRKVGGSIPGIVYLKVTSLFSLAVAVKACDLHIQLVYRSYGIQNII